MQNANELFQKVTNFSKKSSLLHSFYSLSIWDQETYIPKGAHEFRSEMLSLLSGMIHERNTDKEFEKELSQLIDLESGQILFPELSHMQKACLREWRRDIVHAKKLPNSFVKEFSELTSKAISVWAEAREKNQFSLFQPYLEKIISLCKKKADYLGYNGHPYNALLDEFEPYATTKELDPILGNLKEKLTDLLTKIQQSPAIDAKVLDGIYPQAKQKELGQHLFEKIFHDTDNARLDISHHPFSMGVHPTDIRLTTRINEKEFLSNLLSVMHECGHALYDHGMKTEYFGTPAAEAISLGIHESQSRWWETLIGRSLPFWKFFYPKLQNSFPKFQQLSLEDFYRAIHKVEPSFIRVEADEVTYCLHVILRYELEKELMEGKVEVKDLPEAWNAKCHELLGITPSNNQEGCLQDIHWSSGLFGYFPTYALGNLYACQFFQTFTQIHPDWAAKVAKGDFAFIRSWLKEQIHQHGKVYTAGELVNKVTGKPLSEAPYIEHLTSKYGLLYANLVEENI